ncbi:uncharacterized protein LOC115244625 [Formica exsecta]|uniref:uncharacterized protein LOC115244625 n=1 Tax=Formica exsecta TaxID=72781 RepID=UPI0011437A2D|nr:uncharacterized protein LOC115244625 [Formica exsecta]
MKTFVLITYVLTVTAMVYTTDVQKVRIFYSAMASCANQLRLLNQPSPDVLECILHRFGLIDELGMLNKYATSRYLEDLISDPNKLWQARYQLESCFNHGNVPENNNHENTMRIIKCAAPVVGLID